MTNRHCPWHHFSGPYNRSHSSHDDEEEEDNRDDDDDDDEDNSDGDCILGQYNHSTML